MAKKKAESKACSIINKILEKVRANKRIAKNVWIYGRDDNQAIVGIPPQFADESCNEIIIEPNNEGTKISLTRYFDDTRYRGIDVNTINEAYEQIKYFSVNGKFKIKAAY